MAIETKVRPRGRVTVEFGDDFGRNIAIMSLVGITVRGEFSLSRMQLRKDQSKGRRNGQFLGSKSPNQEMQGLPQSIPGERMTLDFGNNQCTIFDPLNEPEQADLVRRLETVLKRGLRIGSGAESKLDFEMPRVMKLDDDQMKTLLLELRQKVNNNEAKIIDGALPDEKVIRDSFPGRELFDPRCMSIRRKPKYKEDLDAWEEEIDKANMVAGS